jgi:hypothetical protein
VSSESIERYDSEAAQAARDRRLPPMSQMTRIQKRYFLEPWFTTGMVAFWALTMVAWICACILPWHVELTCLGGVFLLAGGGCGWAKWWHQDANGRTESQVVASPRSRDYDRY